MGWLIAWVALLIVFAIVGVVLLVSSAAPASDAELLPIVGWAAAAATVILALAYSGVSLLQGIF